MNKKRLDQENLTPEPKTDFKETVTEFISLIRTQGLLAPKQVSNYLLEMKKSGALSPYFLAIYNYILVERTATRQRIIEDLGFSESIVYKIVPGLVQQGYIKKSVKIRGHAKGGLKADLYTVLDATPTEIAEARVKEEQRLIPGLNLAREITQFIIDDYVPTTPTPSEISLGTMKRIIGFNFDISGYSKPAMYDIIARHVQKKGVKVWQ